MSGSAQQWLRACSLTVADQTGNGVELSGPDLSNSLRIKFTVTNAVTSSPATMHARVYNLAPATIQNIQSLASKNPPTINAVPFPSSAKVVLKAGYQSNAGTLFTGTVYQLRVGKETNVDSYMDIFAADGDIALNWSNVNTTFAKKYTSEDLWNAANKSMAPWQVTAGAAPDGLSTTPSPRGRVLYGMTRDRLDEMARYNNFNWNIVNGQVSSLPKFQTLPGQAVVINSSTGQIGVPEQTEEGITIACLLNPAIRWGTRVKLDNTQIATLALNEPGKNGPAVSPNAAFQGSKSFVPVINTDGIYKVLHCNHVGDTRGNEWYTRLICLSVDPSAVPPAAVPIASIPT